MEYPGLPGRLEQVRQVITGSQAKGGWTHPVRVVAVTKGHGPEAVRAAVQAGLTDVGENRVQEAVVKQDALGSVDVAWHLIGSLQRNKVRQAVSRFAVIHSVDRPELVTELGKRQPTERSQPVLIEVNCSGEPQKGGVEPENLEALADQIRGMAGLELRGLMTMAALSEDEAVVRGAFSRLRTLREGLERSGHHLPELSMGMSGDYALAVEEGATMVRLGTLLFGERRV
ncbi:MAG: YggS family pyridoxal phosphate-dependent enzyme [Gemmatimonadota bacterium]